MADTIKPAMSKAAWSRRAEQGSLEGDQRLLEQAEANTLAAASDPAFLTGLAREICQIRGRELTLAYRNLVKLMPGFHHQQINGRSSATDTVCVVFIVRRKVSMPNGGPQLLPRQLITYADWNGARLPFAIPTDVRDAARFSPATAHKRGHIWLENGHWPAAMGNFACVVELLHGGVVERCLLSAQHVLTPFAPVTAFEVHGGLEVCPDNGSDRIDSAHPLGKSLAIGGLLRSDENPKRPSFDVQLASIAAIDDLQQRTAARNLRPAHPFATSESDLYQLATEGSFYLMAPAVQGPSFHAPMECRLYMLPIGPEPLTYRFGGLTWEEKRTVYHTGLICFECTGGASPQAGDSGSAIILRYPNGDMTLVGMHIGGGEGLSWAIPAWRLFDMRNWNRFPAGATIRPVNP